jgi:hypothetical protein
MKSKKSSHKSASRPAASRPAATRRNPSVDDLLGMVDLPEVAAGTDFEAAPAPAAASAAPAAQVVKIAKITGLDPKGRPLLKMPGAKSKPIAARSTLRVTHADVGREALVLFENGDPSLPIITGLLEAPDETTSPAKSPLASRAATQAEKAAPAQAASAAGPAPEKLVYEAGQELVLKVGKASITLTKDGRIVIRGADVLTRSSGSNRIKGGAVHIN